MKIVEHVKSILEMNKKYCKNGKVFKNNVIEASLRLDNELLQLLIKDDITRKHFFKELDGVLIFDKIKFQNFISNKEFLPDSFTAYKNKIGLTANSSFLTEANEIVLNYPYKDCILEGGQTKEDQKREEVFWNETLAPDEIDRIFEPKVLNNWIKFSKNGEENISSIPKNSSYLIKGNNLQALHSIKKKFNGKVKLIYIDPPYNTGKDGFGYNDTFNHSSWLTFMKNRLTVAHELLNEQGCIFISLDDKEVHYLKVLMDEIFGRENFISTIIWNSKYTISNDAKFVSYQHENILFYAKNKSNFKIGLFDRTEEQNKSYRNPDNDKKGPWKATPIHAKSGSKGGIYNIVFPNGKEWTAPKGRYPRYSKTRLLEIYNEGGLYFNKNGGVDKKTYLSEVKQGISAGSVWHYSEVGHTHKNNEELAKILGKGAFDNPKGTDLMFKIFKVANLQDGDFVLDFFAGSGTTGQAALEYSNVNNINLSFILCEQMDYIERVTLPRVKYAIEKNQEGEFIYVKLARNDDNIKSRIGKIVDKNEAVEMINDLINSKVIHYKFYDILKSIDIEDFSKLDLRDMKRLLISAIDNNVTYIPFGDIDDVEYSIPENIKKLNKIFYGS